METWGMLAAFWPALADGKAALCLFSHPPLLLIPLGALVLTNVLQRHPKLRLLLPAPCLWLAITALQKAGHLFQLLFPVHDPFVPGILLCILLALWASQQQETGMLLFLLPALPIFLLCLLLPRQPAVHREVLSFSDILPFLLPAVIQKKPVPEKGMSSLPKQALVLFDFLLLQALILSRLPPANPPLAALSQPCGPWGHSLAVITLYMASVLQCALSLRGIRCACQSAPMLSAFLPGFSSSRKEDIAG